MSILPNLTSLPEYRHGAYGVWNAVINRNAGLANGAVIYIGTAPVNTVAGGAENVNKPIAVHSIAEARRYFGYSDNWADFTLCEPMYRHLVKKGVGPIILINVLDPVKHKTASSATKTLTPINGRAVFTDAQNVILDSVTVAGKTKGTDYALSYNENSMSITIYELVSGALGTTALTVTYDSIDPASVSVADIIGETDDLGTNTGAYALKNVYSVTGYIPAYVGCPGFSSVPQVNRALLEICRKINSHWDAWLFADMPLLDSTGTGINLQTAATWKTANGYTDEAETVCFPMVTATDGRHYHLSVVRAANFQELLYKYDGIPYHSASNTGAEDIANLWFGEGEDEKVYDDYIINERLNKHGITSAAYLGGSWVIWGASAADYNQDDKDEINVAETNRMMLFYVSNDFQHRRCRDVDKPLTPNDVATLVAEEQQRLDALVHMGALTYGLAYMNSDYIAKSDMRSGDYTFTFDVTTTPLAKSLTAVVNWVDTGFETYFDVE